jgi:hypothetical protein
MERGRRWTIQDRIGNRIYLTDERWSHIIDPTNHPELAGLEAEVQETIRTGQRKQDALNPQKYRYSKAFGHLPEDNTHAVVIVLFRYAEGPDGKPIANNYIVTAYLKEVG